jgi:thiol-disulfide isomerase/thioredoxin
MRQNVLALTVTLVGLPLVGLHVAYKQQPTATEIARLSEHFKTRLDWVGKVAPDFELELLSGEKFKLSDHVGKDLIVVNFFATWCEPCRGEMPELSRLAEQNRGKPLFMLGVDAEEKHDLVVAFVRDMKLGFPVGIDDSGDVLKRFGVDSYPTTLLIGADGRIQLYQNGAISNSEVAFSGFLEAGLGELNARRGISKDDYLTAAAHETYPSKAQPGAAAGPVLSPRGKEIAGRMDCPCGCDKKVEGCGCATAKKIKSRLATTKLDGRTDEEVAREMDREFCMKGM